MKRKIRNSVFETNSSSMHSLSYTKYKELEKSKLEIDEEGKKGFYIYDVGNLSFDSSDISKVIEKPNYEKLNIKLKEKDDFEKE